MTIREALARGVSGADGSALAGLAAELEQTVCRPARASAGPPARVMVGHRPRRGPWLGYLLGRDRSSCWLALGWTPRSEAGAVRLTLPVDLDGQFRLGPIVTDRPAPGPSAAVLLWVEYRAEELPPDHRLRNDLHAMVMLHDLLA